MNDSSDQDRTTEAEDWRSDPKVFAELVGRGMSRGVRRAIKEHHKLGYAVPIIRDGQLGLLYPDGSFRPREEPSNPIDPQHDR